jgi:hypothetical protein
MLLNPYYYIFSKIYKWLKSLNVQDDGILFSSSAVLFMIFIPHFFLLLSQFKDHQILTFEINIPKYIFGVGFTFVFLSINYLVFGFRDRYIKVIECYEDASKTAKLINLIILLVYFSIPFVLILA